MAAGPNLARVSTRRFEDRPRPPCAIGHYDRVDAPKIPQYHELMWPALQATKELGGSATVSEMNERAMASAGITEEQQAVPHGEDGRMSEVEYRLHWARTHLKGIGALENSARGASGL
jgi:restriction system protein